MPARAQLGRPRDIQRSFVSCADPPRRDRSTVAPTAHAALGRIAPDTLVVLLIDAPALAWELVRAHREVDTLAARD
jgi:hypothetical protein